MNNKYRPLIFLKQAFYNNIFSFIASLERLGTISKLIILLNIGFYLVSLLLSPGGNNLSLNPFSALSPDIKSLLMLGASGRVSVLEGGAYFNLIAASFLHGSLLHLLFNMAAFYHISSIVEKIFGSFRFFLIYIFSAFSGFSLSLLAQTYLSVGASGGICGLIGALFYYGRNKKGPYSALIYKDVKGWIFALVLIGLLMPSIDNWGHLGGFISGFFFAWFFYYLRKSSKKELINQLISITAVVLFFLLLLLLFYLAFTALIFKFFIIK